MAHQRQQRTDARAEAEVTNCIDPPSSAIMLATSGRGTQGTERQETIAAVQMHGQDVVTHPSQDRCLRQHHALGWPVLPDV